ncbi:hypothetical protein WAF17_02695 [Bernardetia sp. ABR2-2B]|uniref:hypothetical protein n=1 Tax=Bernardetia sp. ABR2-2B TaxID=3127472 RepID=UPI0030CAC580
MDLENMTPEVLGDVEAKGIETTIYYALRSDIETMPTYPVVTNPEDIVTVTGDIIFKTGKCFKEMKLRVDKNGVKSSLVGEIQSKSWNNMLDVSIPTNHPKLLGTIDYLKNREVVYVFKERCTNSNRMMGSDCNPATFDTAEIDSGTDQESFKGFNGGIKSSGKLPAFYSGVITTTPAA